MPNPIYDGEPVRQTEFSTSLDANAFPTGTSVTTFVEVEVLPDGGVFDWPKWQVGTLCGIPEVCVLNPKHRRDQPSGFYYQCIRRSKSAPQKEISPESEHAGPEKAGTSRDVPATEEEGENSQNSPGCIRALSLLCGGAFFLPILLLPMVS